MWFPFREYYYSLWLARSMPLVILSLKLEVVPVVLDVDDVPSNEGLGRILNLRSGEGSLEITIKFWTVKLLLLFEELVFWSASRRRSLLTSSDTSKDVMAVMVLNWSIDKDEEHLDEVKDFKSRSSPFKRGMDSEVAKPSKLSRVIWLVSRGWSVFSCKKKINKNGWNHLWMDPYKILFF